MITYRVDLSVVVNAMAGTHIMYITGEGNG